MRPTPHIRMLLAAIVLATSMAACAAISGRETAGEYVDDAAITTKVKAAIFDEPSLHSMQVNVETMQNVVQLSGFVDTQTAKSKAGELAGNVDGVLSVENDLVVR